jgi:hypothetical protein
MLLHESGQIFSSNLFVILPIRDQKGKHACDQRVKVNHRRTPEGE